MPHIQSAASGRSAHSNMPVLRAVLVATEVAPVAILQQAALTMSYSKASESPHASDNVTRLSEESATAAATCWPSLARRSSRATEAKGSHLPDPWASEHNGARNAHLRMLRAKPRTYDSEMHLWLTRLFVDVVRRVLDSTKARGTPCLFPGSSRKSNHWNHPLMEALGDGLSRSAEPTSRKASRTTRIKYQRMCREPRPRKVDEAQTTCPLCNLHTRSMPRQKNS